MPVRLKRALIAAGGLLVMGALLAACGVRGEAAESTMDGAAPDATIVNVAMVETWEKWGFTLDRTKVPAGVVTFEVTNDGNFTHELMVYPDQDLSSMSLELVEAVWASDDAAHEDEEEGSDDGDAHGEAEEAADEEDAQGEAEEAADDGDAHGEAEEGTGEEDVHGEMIEGLVMTAEGEGELVLAPGQSGTFTVSLTPGSYGLGCLIIETVGGETFTHYEKGMHSTLTVQ